MYGQNYGFGGYLGDGDFSLGGYANEFGADAGPQPTGPGGARLVARMQPLPMDELSLAASASGNATTEPQRGFAPVKFFVASTIGVYFKITDIKVGQETQFVSTGTIYGELFSEISNGMNLKGTPARLGNNITVSVTNRDAATTRVFSGTFIGNTYEI